MPGVGVGAQVSLHWVKPKRAEGSKTEHENSLIVIANNFFSVPYETFYIPCLSTQSLNKMRVITGKEIECGHKCNSLGQGS